MTTLYGTEGDDTLTGTDDADVIYGLGGADTITGADGNDRLEGGDGADLIDGSNGDDIIRGGEGADEIWGGLGADRIDGGAGDDQSIVNIERGDNVGPPSDPLDIVFGGEGNDTITTHNSSAEEFPLPMFADGGIGNDTIQGGWGDDTLLGGDGNDVISGRVGNDLIDGGAGDDDLTWGDVANGGSGDGLLIGGAGNDVLHGSLLVPSMDGGDGDDVLAFDRGGVGGGHTFEGGAGQDTFNIGTLDHLDLTAANAPAITGIERIDMTPIAATDVGSALTVDHDSVVALSNDTDTLIVDGDANDRVIALGDWTANGTESIGEETYARFDLDGATLLVNEEIGTQPGQSNEITGTAGDDTLFGTPNDDTMMGLAGSDQLFGGEGDDVLHGGDAGDFIAGDGGDRLDGGAGNDLLNGGAGADTFVFAPGYGEDRAYWFEDGIDKLDLRGFDFSSFDDFRQSVTATAGQEQSGASNLTLDFGNGDTFVAVGIDALTADDVILAGGTQLGTAGDDTLTGTSGDDTLIGDAGADTLRGGDGDDALHGGNTGDLVPGDGGDVLDGGAGNDLLNGGAGGDTFVFGPGYGQDQVYWFENGLDRIDLGAFGLSGLGDLQSTATITEGSLSSGASFVDFDFGNGDTLTAIGVSVAGLGQSDFIF
jgi:Ca2+-binding RTX toxin-like protein